MSQQRGILDADFRTPITCSGKSKNKNQKKREKNKAKAKEQVFFVYAFRLYVLINYVWF